MERAGKKFGEIIPPAERGVTEFGSEWVRVRVGAGRSRAQPKVP